MESIQGEGLYIGTRHIFIRFAGCNLRCKYCDTPASVSIPEQCNISINTGKNNQVKQIQNPLSVDQILEIVNKYSSKWVSLTGGEPLLSADFIYNLGPILRENNYKILLETNGTLSKELELCLPSIDVISMDIKLPSFTNKNYFEEHEAFLKKVKQKDIYIKIVISEENSMEEVDHAVRLISNQSINIPLILQPVTTNNIIKNKDIDFLLMLQKKYLQQLKDVRIIPQLHSLINLT